MTTLSDVPSLAGPPSLHDLPAPPPGRTGWPWTEASAPLPPALPDGRPWPRITVVTPSYNQGAFVEETIRSVLLQGYPDLEYVVVDGGSTDGSVAVIEKYERWIARWVSEPDRGQTHAINKGFGGSTGEVMGWVNSDDLLLPNALAHVGRTMGADPGTDVVCGFRLTRLDGGQGDEPYVHPRPKPGTLERDCYVAQETVYWRRKVYDVAGPLDEEYTYTMDYEYWQRILASGFEFTLIPEFMGVIRIHGSAKGSTMEDVRLMELRKVYKKYLNTDKDTENIKRELNIFWRSRTTFLYKVRLSRFHKSKMIYKFIVPLLCW